MKTRKTGGFVVSAALLLLLAACSTGVTLTFGVSSGDMIQVGLDTSDGYSLRQNQGHFFVDRGEDQILEGIFLLEEAYGQYAANMDQPQVKVLEEGETETFSYCFYEYSGDTSVENNYLIWVLNSSTGVLVGGGADVDEAKAAFDKLSFSVVE